MMVLTLDGREHHRGSPAIFPRAFDLLDRRPAHEPAIDEHCPNTLDHRVDGPHIFHQFLLVVGGLAPSLCHDRAAMLPITFFLGLFQTVRLGKVRQAARYGYNELGAWDKPALSGAGHGDGGTAQSTKPPGFGGRTAL